jgi:hypothetical protein
MSEALPACRRSHDVSANAGARVRVFGEYVDVDARQRPDPPAQYRGHAAIRLEDGALVQLEPTWAEAALRSAGERARFAGKAVEAIGVLWASPPEPPEPVAYMLGPCLSPVESIAERD